MDGGGDALNGGCIRQHSAGKLLDGELVKRLIAVDGLDHPLAKRPDGKRTVPPPACPHNAPDQAILPQAAAFQLRSVFVVHLLLADGARNKQFL